MKLSNKTKKTLGNVGIVVLIVAIVTLIPTLFSIGADDSDFEKVNLTYAIGGIDEATGRPVENECALYTKNAIECTGVELYADFDSEIKYTVYFYDDDENFISCQSNTGLNMTVDEMPEGATHIRIAIYPQNDENDEIGTFEKYTYKNQLTVKVRTVEVDKADDDTAA